MVAQFVEIIDCFREAPPLLKTVTQRVPYNRSARMRLSRTVSKELTLLYNRRTPVHFCSGVHGWGGGFEPPTCGLCDLSHLSMRVGVPSSTRDARRPVSTPSPTGSSRSSPTRRGALTEKFAHSLRDKAVRAPNRESCWTGSFRV